MPGVNFHKTLIIGEDYQRTKDQTTKILGRNLEYLGLFIFKDLVKSITFSSERLIPNDFKGKPCVMLIFSNAHLFSVHQGMFLSPNTLGRENLFWYAMREAGWIKTSEVNLTPKQLADIYFHIQYQGPFDLFFHCYYAFPTSYLEYISKIFGEKQFRQFVEPEAMDEFH